MSSGSFACLEDVNVKLAWIHTYKEARYLPCEATTPVFFAAIQVLEVGDHADIFLVNDNELLGLSN
jgi:hypothetical protein